MTGLPVVTEELGRTVTVLREYTSPVLQGLALVECSHAARTGPICQFCKGAADTTDDFTRRVKLLAVAPRELVLL